MSSLVSCIKKAGPHLSAANKRALMARAKEMRGDLDKPAADRSAVEAVIKDITERLSVASVASSQSRGVNVEVAPKPGEQLDRWSEMPPEGKADTTNVVGGSTIRAILSELGLKGWGATFSTGRFEGETNPTIVVNAPESATGAELVEFARVAGFVFDQKAVIAFDENDTESGSQAGFVRVDLPAGLSAAQVESVRDAIGRSAPEAQGDTLRDGALVYGNFSETPDQEFRAKIIAALEGADIDAEVSVSDVHRFRSEWIEPGSRDEYLRGTRYESEPSQGAEGGAAGRQGGDLDRLRRIASEADRKRDKFVEHYRASAGVADRKPGEKPGVEYGNPRDGAAEVDAVHFSPAKRSALSGEFHGSGLKGAERERLDGAPPELRRRIYFYVNTGAGVQPEAGVGAHAHAVTLKNVYDADADVLGIAKAGGGANAIEQRIVAAGFDGYVTRRHNKSGAAVLIGEHSVPVEYRGTADRSGG
ncbi:MAG: hypothetical protein ACRC2G_13770, partial [Aestuariivirga sp.]